MSNLIWYEKYRPVELDDMILTDEYYDIFKTYLDEESIPHLLFYGPPGSGKTTLSKIIIESLPCVTLTLNASSKDRGIDVIKNRVKQFASSEVEIGKSLKIVFLDEADGLTPDAQKALKNTIETYSAKCRFIMTANEVSKINDALRSRTTPFEFTSFGKNGVIDYCLDILESEDVKHKESDVEIIVKRLYPDVRSILNNLQKCSVKKELDVSNLMVYNITEEEITELIKGGELRKLRESWAGAGSFNWVYDYLFSDFILQIGEELRGPVALIVAEYLFRDTTIADKEINIAGCIISIMQELGVEIEF